MKKYVSALVLLFSFIVCGASYAADPIGRSDEKQGKVDASELKKEKERRKKIEEKRAELEATQWQITLKSKDPRTKPENDTLIFQNGEFRTESLVKRGFNPTNYTVSIPDGEGAAAVFETMQTGKEGHVFIKGQWTKDSMEGEILEQLDGGKRGNEYYFSNAKMTKIEPGVETEKKPAETIETPKALVSTEKSEADRRRN